MKYIGLAFTSAIVNIPMVGVFIASLVSYLKGDQPRWLCLLAMIGALFMGIGLCILVWLSKDISEYAEYHPYDGI